MNPGALLAMPVNFGWPWRAFTTIALCVGGASGLLLALLRSPLRAWSSRDAPWKRAVLSRSGYSGCGYHF